jgi:hypothetical protein
MVRPGLLWIRLASPPLAVGGPASSRQAATANDGGSGQPCYIVSAVIQTGSDAPPPNASLRTVTSCEVSKFPQKPPTNLNHWKGSGHFPPSKTHRNPRRTRTLDAG